MAMMEGGVVVHVYSVKELYRFAHEVFLAVGVPDTDATWVAETLVRADLQGLSSHGLSRMEAYVSGISRGKINAEPTMRMNPTGLVTTMVDGDNALGSVVARACMRVAGDAAQRFGVGVVTAKQANHAGILSIYSELATERGLIGLALSNAQPAIPPWGGRRAYFGTNPIAFAAPRTIQPLSIDMATSVVARGKIIQAAKRSEPIPDGWAMDEYGVPTTDASAALRGSIQPMAGAKGYGLALVVEVLSGVLSGANVGDTVGSIYDDTPGCPGTGMFFLAINPANFVGTHAFAQRMERLASEVHHNPVADGFEEVLLPGERRWRTSLTRWKVGIPLSTDTVSEMEHLAQALEVELPRSLEGIRESRV